MVRSKCISPNFNSISVWSQKLYYYCCVRCNFALNFPLIPNFLVKIISSNNASFDWLLKQQYEHVRVDLAGIDMVWVQTMSKSIQTDGLNRTPPIPWGYGIAPNLPPPTVGTLQKLIKNIKGAATSLRNTGLILFVQPNYSFA